jgi:5,10-methylenetetrahydrofolate reductase
VKLSPLACSAWMLEEGLEPIMQLTARDRNLMALQSDLLAAWALGVRTILGLTGDPLKVGKYEGVATQVGDVDSTGLAKLLVSLNNGELAAGETLSRPTGFLIAGAANPLVDQVAKLESKLDAGVGLFQSNIVYDVERFAEWWAPMVEAGVHERAPLLVGVTPPRSKRMLQFMHDKIPGIEVDDATFARIDGLEGDEAKAAGVEIAVDVIKGVRQLTGIAGVHIMAPGWEIEAVPRVVEGAGLARV